MRTNWKPLPDDLSPAARELAERLRALKDDSGLSLAEIGSRTHYARSSWERWLNGKRLVTAHAVESIAQALGANPAPLLALVGRALVSQVPDSFAAPRSESDASAPAAGAPQGPATDTPIAQLPMGVADFSGREDEIGWLLRTLVGGSGGPGMVPVCAVAGGGGVGKTALAVHAAHQAAPAFPDGQLFVDLRGADPAPREPGEVLGHFLAAFGVPPGELPGDVEERAARLRSVLADRRVLIVLDNARDPAQIRPLIPAAPGCAVLVTSRSKLASLAGARHLDLDLLPDTAAVDLLECIVGTDRTAREPAALASILDSCAGLPLALRIAGARLAARPSWTLESFAAKLADRRRRLDELAVSDLAVRACFDLSYAQLATTTTTATTTATTTTSVDVARVFLVAALVPAPAFDAEEAAALLGDPRGGVGAGGPEVEAALEHLVDIHLLIDEGEGRYAFHDLVRTYALHLLDEHESADERSRRLLRLAGWYAATVEAAAQAIDRRILLLPAAEPEPGTPAPPDLPDRDAALAWSSRHAAALAGAIDAAGACARPDLAARIAVHSMSYALADLTVDWRDWLERALRTLRGHDEPAAEAAIRTRLGVCAGLWEHFEECVAELERALALYEACADPVGQLTTQLNLTIGYGRLQRHGEALEHARLALAGLAAQPSPPPAVIEARVRVAMADAHLYSQNFESAVEHYRLGIALIEPGTRDLPVALNNLGDAYRGLGRADEAIASVQGALRAATELGDLFLQADSLHTLGRVFDHFGRRSEARDCWVTSLAGFEEIGFAPGAERARASLADLDERRRAGALAMSRPHLPHRRM